MPATLDSDKVKLQKQNPPFHVGCTIPAIPTPRKIEQLTSNPMTSKRRSKEKLRSKQHTHSHTGRNSAGQLLGRAATKSDETLRGRVPGLARFLQQEHVWLRRGTFPPVLHRLRLAFRLHMPRFATKEADANAVFRWLASTVEKTAWTAAINDNLLLSVSIKGAATEKRVSDLNIPGADESKGTNALLFFP